MKQASFLPKLRLDHGGNLLEGRRKTARPFSHRHALHVVFKSHRARGQWSLLTRKNERRVTHLLHRIARRYHIRVYRFVNVGNHLHLLLKTETKAYAPAKQEFHQFLKQFAGEVAFQVTQAKKGEAKGGFWEKRVYSRLISWGRENDTIKRYFSINFFESKGLGWGLRPTHALAQAMTSLRAAGVGPPLSAAS